MLIFNCHPVDPNLGLRETKYIELKYKYSQGNKVLNVSLTTKVLGWS